MKRLLSLLTTLLLLTVLAVPQGRIGTPTGGGGSDFVTESFTEGSDTNLQLHTGEVGATWTLHPSYSGTALVNALLDRVYLNTSAAAAYFASGVPSSATYCVEAEFRRMTQMAANVSIILAFDTTADTGILLRANDNGTSFQWEVFDRTNGSNGTVTSSASNQPAVGGAAVTMEMCRSGSSITVTASGVQDNNLNFTTGITAIGRPGMRFSAQASATTGIHLDSFSAR